MDTSCGLPSTNVSMVTAAARVTTASWAPRMRSAGSPTITPATLAMPAATRSEIGNGRPVPISDSMRPATPAKAVWAREICPTIPVSTTSDRAMSVLARLVITPKR